MPRHTHIRTQISMLSSICYSDTEQPIPFLPTVKGAGPRGIPGPQGSVFCFLGNDMGEQGAAKRCTLISLAASQRYSSSVPLAVLEGVLGGA